MSPRERTESFSSKVKAELVSVQRKKGCCRRAFSDALALKEASCDRAALIGEEKMICPHCAESFLAGLFVSFGNVSDPNSAHHLEFSVPSKSERDSIVSFLSGCGFSAKSGSRKGRFLAYFKKSDEIEDILAFMGATNAVFEHINSRIVKGIRNDTNRRVNFDSANISKSLNAANDYIIIINRIIDGGFFNELSAELRETARLRIEYPDVTLGSLGTKFQKPISKSGVKHRLDKITDFAKKKELI